MLVRRPHRFGMIRDNLETWVVVWVIRRTLVAEVSEVEALGWATSDTGRDVSLLHRLRCWEEAIVVWGILCFRFLCYPGVSGRVAAADGSGSKTGRRADSASVAVLLSSIGLVAVFHIATPVISRALPVRSLLSSPLHHHLRLARHTAGRPVWDRSS